MTTHYLVQGSNGKYRIRKGIFGFFPFFHEFLYFRHSDLQFLHCDKHASLIGFYETEDQAFAVWEAYKKATRLTFTTLYKLG